MNFANYFYIFFLIIYNFKRKIFIKICLFVIISIILAPKFQAQTKEDLDKCSKKQDSLLRVNFQKTQPPKN